MIQALLIDSGLIAKASEFPDIQILDGHQGINHSPVINMDFQNSGCPVRNSHNEEAT